jgi:hypothetical protein
VSYGSALSRIVLTAGGTFVREVTGIERESWIFDDEHPVAGGDWFKELDFNVYLQKLVFEDISSVTTALVRS